MFLAGARREDRPGDRRLGQAGSLSHLGSVLARRHLGLDLSRPRHPARPRVRTCRTARHSVLENGDVIPGVFALVGRRVSPEPGFSTVGSLRTIGAFADWWSPKSWPTGSRGTLVGSAEGLYFFLPLARRRPGSSSDVRRSVCPIADTVPDAPSPIRGDCKASGVL